MKLSRLFIATVLLFQFNLQAQVAGNSVYGVPKNTGAAIATGDLFTTEPSNSVPVSFVEANVLLNLKPDAYQAVFALSQEGDTVPQSNEKLTAQAKEFMAALESLGVKPADICVDFIGQNRVYDFDVQNNVAKEKLSGFEVKKNVIVRYHDAALLDKMLAAASKASIFDLVKVDYIVSDMPAARARLLAEASNVIKEKEATYARLLDIKLRRTSVFQEKYGAYFPADMYKSYTAFESGNADSYNLRVVRGRKTSTFYYSPLESADFDKVINPAGVEPVVQLTLYLKVRYLQP
jgi:uncharacterized protein YggE